MSKPILVFPLTDGDDVQTTSEQLVKLSEAVRNNTLCEVLSVITDKLDPIDNYERQMGLIGVLKAVNELRTPEHKESKK